MVISIMLQISPHTRYTNTPDGGILLNTETGKMYDLNCMATSFWIYVERGMTFDEIVEIVVSRFPQLSRDQIVKDIREFINSLLSYGFLLAV